MCSLAPGKRLTSIFRQDNPAKDDLKSGSSLFFAGLNTALLSPRQRNRKGGVKQPGKSYVFAELKGRTE
jgi:hypothetical protein